VSIVRLSTALLALAMTMMDLTQVGAAAVAAPSTRSTKVYVYTDRRGHWCAVADAKTYDRKASAENEAREIVEDFGTIQYSGNTPTKVSRAQTDADAEWWTETTYSLDRTGNVIGAELYQDSTEGEQHITRRHRYHYSVRGGLYVPLSIDAKKAAKDLIKVRSLASMPFAGLLDKARRSPGHRTFCS